ncbi:MAG: hypothetical protein WCT20_03555 [Candidatus Babeliales bacterium]
MKTKIILGIFSFFTALTVALQPAPLPPSVEAAAFAKAFSQEMPSQLCCQTMKNALEKNTPQLFDVALGQRRVGVNVAAKNFNDSFMEFIKRVYNHECYAQVLSQDGADLVQFLDLTKEAALDPQEAYVGLRLFTNKLKASEVIDDSVLDQILPSIIKNMAHYFSEETKADDGGIDFIKKNIENIILMQLTSHLDQFQKMPETFVSDVSGQIASALQKQWKTAQKKMCTTAEAKVRLRMGINKFLELALSKLVWSPKFPETIWPSFLNIADKLQLLGVHKIIDHMDDMDDLFWTLTHRFCFFLDLTGGALPVAVHDVIEQQLATKAVYFLEMKEQDQGITSKKEILAGALLKSRMRAIAFERKGFVA